MLERVVGAVLLVAAIACSRPATPGASQTDRTSGPQRGGHHMMQVEIEGPPDELRGLTGRKGVAGLDLVRRVDELDDGRWKIYGTVESQEVIDELEKRGLTVHVVMDEDEINRRIDLDKEMMKDAGGDGNIS